MPKVTLLRNEWSTYDLLFGTATFSFKGGSPREVPVSVALICKKKVNGKGEPLFKVEGVEGKVVKKIKHPKSAPKQNVRARQLRLADGLV